MKTSTSSAAESPQHQLQALWTWIKRRRLLVVAVAIVMLGLALGWNWLAAIGALPILFFLPCLLMVGMCMKGMGSNNAGGSCSQNKQPAGSADSATTAAPVSLPGSTSSVIEEKTHA